MTAWTNYVKQYAKDKGITYKNALQDPACASSYRSGREKPSAPTTPAKEENIQIKIEEKPKKRGRPKKYPTLEEAKKAKSAKTMESNKRKKAEKIEAELEGKDIIAGHKTENTNSLAHIYPISHELVLQMLSCCPNKKV